MATRAKAPTELDIARIRRYVKGRIAASVAAEVRLEVEFDGVVVTIVERRPPWRADDGPQWSRRPMAQLRFDATRSTWSLFWPRANGRWQRYDRLAPTGILDGALKELAADPDAVFWG